MKRLFLISVVLIAGIFSGIESGFIPLKTTVSPGSSNSDHIFAAAYDNHQSNIQVQGYGKVIRILPDDNDGSRHQKFIIQLSSGQTLLVAHNTDLAERVEPLETGDLIEFNGEYEWNQEGGVIHWTHHDPHGNHMTGWLKHDGRTYQ